ncbi:hypothetical protein M109_3063 [Bacteroides fragilis str. 3397 N2]|nr:hypothetical protein M109_3063 [Bacteroides fragilis str. 3397 N2]
MYFYHVTGKSNSLHRRDQKNGNKILSLHCLVFLPVFSS